MDIDIKILTGDLKMMNVSFSFVFDGEVLKLIPFDPEDVFRLQNEEIRPGVYAYRGLPQISENVLIGHCNENGQKIVFIVPIGGSISSYNHVLEIYPLAYIKCRFSGKTVSRLGFTCRELNHIYPINQAYNTKAIINESSIEDLSVQTKKYNETKSIEQPFIQDSVEVKSYFSVGCSYTSSNDKAPLTFNSYLFFEFQETEDYLFLFKLCNTAYDFLRFLCNRNNIKFTKIQISSPYKDDKFIESGEMVLLREVSSEEYPIKRELYIHQKDIQGSESRLLQEIADETLYLRHIPETHEAGRQITPAFFVMIVSAFEWEYRKLFPGGVVKKPERIKAEDEVWNAIESLRVSSRGRVRKIYKDLRDHVRDNNLAAKIEHVTKELNDLLDPFGKYLYSVNETELKYKEMSERLATQRNNYAHGNLDKEFDETTILDLMLLQKIILLMQLKRVGVSDLRAQKAVCHLYHLNIELEEDKTAEPTENEKAFAFYAYNLSLISTGLSPQEATEKAHQTFDAGRVVNEIKEKLSNVSEYDEMVISSNPTKLYDTIMELLVCDPSQDPVEARNKRVKYVLTKAVIEKRIEPEDIKKHDELFKRVGEEKSVELENLWSRADPNSALTNKLKSLYTQRREKIRPAVTN